MTFSKYDNERILSWLGVGLTDEPLCWTTLNAHSWLHNIKHKQWDKIHTFCVFYFLIFTYGPDVVIHTGVFKKKLKPSGWKALFFFLFKECLWRRNIGSGYRPVDEGGGERGEGRTSIQLSATMTHRSGFRVVLSRRGVCVFVCVCVCVGGGGSLKMFTSWALGSRSYKVNI